MVVLVEVNERALEAVTEVVAAADLVEAMVVVTEAAEAAVVTVVEIVEAEAEALVAEVVHVADLAAEPVDLTENDQQCTLQHVANVTRIAKFHSDQQANDQCSVAIVSESKMDKLHALTDAQTVHLPLKSQLEAMLLQADLETMKL